MLVLFTYYVRPSLLVNKLGFFTGIRFSMDLKSLKCKVTFLSNFWLLRLCWTACYETIVKCWDCYIWLKWDWVVEIRIDSQEIAYTPGQQASATLNKSNCRPNQTNLLSLCTIKTTTRSFHHPLPLLATVFCFEHPKKQNKYLSLSLNTNIFQIYHHFF